MPLPPRPTRLLIFNTLTVILACLAMFACSLWVIVTKSNPFLVLGAPLMLCVPLLIAAMQYRAVFRHSENAARHVGKYLFFTGGLLAIFFAMLTYIYSANEKQIDYQRLEIMGCLTAACVYLLFCGHANQRWARQLQEWEAENEPEINSRPPFGLEPTATSGENANPRHPPSPLAPG